MAKDLKGAKAPFFYIWFYLLVFTSEKFNLGASLRIFAVKFRSIFPAPALMCFAV